MSTNIPYLTETWSPVTGCAPDYECWHRCWARAMAHRFAKPFEPTFHSEALAKPLHWKKPRRVGVSFYGDLFVGGITNEQIAAVFGVMAACPQHTFLILTKRARRMEAWFKWVSRPGSYYPPDLLVQCEARLLIGGQLPLHIIKGTPKCYPWPLPNVHIGVSVANQRDADERIPHLLACPAAVRWVSYEPITGPLNLEGYTGRGGVKCTACGMKYGHDEAIGGTGCRGVDWVVAAAETGPGARPLDLGWVRKVLDDCAAVQVPFMFKNQVGYVNLDGQIHRGLP